MRTPDINKSAMSRKQLKKHAKPPKRYPWQATKQSACKSAAPRVRCNRFHEQEVMCMIPLGPFILIFLTLFSHLSALSFQKRVPADFRLVPVRWSRWPWHSRVGHLRTKVAWRPHDSRHRSRRGHGLEAGSKSMPRWQSRLWPYPGVHGFITCRSAFCMHSRHVLSAPVGVNSRSRFPFLSVTSVFHWH